MATLAGRRERTGIPATVAGLESLCGGDVKAWPSEAGPATAGPAGEGIRGGNVCRTSVTSVTTVDPPTATSGPPNGGRVLDDDAAALLAEWLALTPVPVHEQPLAQSRNSGLVNAEITGPSPVVPSVEDRDVEGVRVRIYRPDVGAAPAVLVYAHGGGWTLLSIDSSDVICRHLATGVGCVVVSVDYRLAPEHPFPA